MPTKVFVQVRDEHGKPMAIEPVWLVPPGSVSILAEFQPEPDQVQSLLLDAKIEGNVQLVLRLPGHPPLGFAMQANPGNDGKKGKKSKKATFSFRGQVPRCAVLTRHVVSKGEEQSLTIVALQFDLAKRHEEIVMVAGVDLKGFTDYTRFTKTLRDELYAGESYFGGTPHPIPRVIHDHTIVTLFDFVHGVRRRQIKGQEGWHELDVVQLGSKVPYIEHGKTVEAEQRRHDEDTISIVHVYDYIAKLGAAAPRTLKQMHVFSHAWVQGPVLLNTSEDDQYKVSHCVGVRDPGDKDPRCKDFCEENIPGFANFRSAFTTDAFIKTWGCFRHALHDYVDAVADLEDPEEMRPAGKQKIPYNSREVVDLLRREALPFSYLGNLVQKAGIEGIGSLPTTTSNYQRVGWRYYMFIDRNNHGRHMAWFERNFGVTLDEWGYVDYRKLF